MRKVEISETALHDEVDQLPVRQVLLDDHVGDHLRYEILEIIPILAAVDDRVDALGGEQ